MKRLLIALVALSSLCALSAFADPAGSAEFLVYPDQGPTTFPSLYQVNDDGGKLVSVSGGTVYLERQNGGYKGFDFGRPFDLACTASACTDNGSTQVELTVTKVNGGYAIDGMLNYVNIHASNANGKIEVSVMGGNSDTSYSLDRQADGSYSGSGATGGFNSFTASLTDVGSLAGLTDPATFVVVLISPLVGN